MLNSLRELVNNVDKKDEESALEIMRILSKEYNELDAMSKIKLDRVYWVSQWSWTPIVDGIFSYEETIREGYSYGEVSAYYTGLNYRTYFPWDICETKEECNEICSLKSKFSYDWEIAHANFAIYNIPPRR